MRIRKHQGGFTLVELIIVIVIFAVLAAVAIPKYLTLQEDAKRGASHGIAGALGSASMANYVIRSGNVPATTYPIANCVDVATLLVPGSMSGFSIAPLPVANGATTTCTVDHDTPGSSTAATFTAHGIS
jgi:MSHA pilin protein MshA